MLQRLSAIAFTLVLFFILLFAYTNLAGPIPFYINQVSTTKSDTFQVTGEGIVEVTPDQATVSVGITSPAPTVKMAQDQINSVINKIGATVKALGVKDTDIKTTNYSINPSYDYQGTVQKITGFTASTNLLIKVKDTSTINEVIDAATKNGANTINSISFDVEDKSKALEAARTEAIAEAKKKAETAAKIAGFKLGRMVNYNESQNGSPQPYPMAYAIGSADLKATPETRVEPGSQEVRLTVTLSYEIR